MNVEVFEASKEHATMLARQLRSMSEDEFERAGRDPNEHLAESIKRSTYAWAGFIDGQIVCICGIELPTLVSNRVYLWLATSPKADEHPLFFARRSKMYIEQLRKNYPAIVGYVYAVNRRSVRWLNWLGFIVHNADENGLCFFELRSH